MILLATIFLVVLIKADIYFVECNTTITASASRFKILKKHIGVYLMPMVNR